jgi:hypothetical protein
MRLSRFLSKHSADAANIRKSNIVNHFNLCATIWKVRIFVFWTEVRGDRRGKGFGAEQLLGLAGSEVTKRIDWVGGWSEPGAFKTATGVPTAAINSSVCDND